MLNPTPEEVARGVERQLLALRKIGRPATRQDWKQVFACLIICTDAALQEFSQQSRTLGVGWLTPVVDGIINEIVAGRAVRGRDGALMLIAKPRDPAFKLIT